MTHKKVAYEIVRLGRLQPNEYTIEEDLTLNMVRVSTRCRTCAASVTREFGAVMIAEDSAATTTKQMFCACGRHHTGAPEGALGCGSRWEISL